MTPMISSKKLDSNVLIFKYPQIINVNKPSTVESKKILKNKLYVTF